jgi:hypothetical protein
MFVSVKDAGRVPRCGLKSYFGTVTEVLIVLYPFVYLYVCFLLQLSDYAMVLVHLVCCYIYNFIWFILILSFRHRFVKPKRCNIILALNFYCRYTKYMLARAQRDRAPRRTSKSSYNRGSGLGTIQVSLNRRRRRRSFLPDGPQRSSADRRYPS